MIILEVAFTIFTYQLGRNKKKSSVEVLTQNAKAIYQIRTHFQSTNIARMSIEVLDLNFGKQTYASTKVNVKSRGKNNIYYVCGYFCELKKATVPTDSNDKVTGAKFFQCCNPKFNS